MQIFDSIPASLIPWIDSQKVFWVATAPLSEDGHVNVSPKGCFDKTMNVIPDNESDARKPTSRAVWYEDFTGSGNETISHLRENGRITVMFTAFEGPPQILRLYGTGKVYEFGTPEYRGLLPPERRQPGSRAVIWVDIHKVITSCGYSIPFFTYKAPRVRLHKFAIPREQADYDASSESTLELSRPEKGIKSYWKVKNIKSIDGLPGLSSAFESPDPPTNWNSSSKAPEIVATQDDETLPTPVVQGSTPSPELGSSGLGNLLFGFGFGVLVGGIAVRYATR
ncbi:hypothetical protein FA15DRAFT_670590 [Coprinopsis marcescibilis]|uniref:Pyridoxamine 5'-phosphate oxidase N-terminal domain-containing protein n=1 Tax=Coprinopsis marcescibilis TaxID=230819 RepID=A0A5C3KS22_COPMA|nr:hypothetical protein FA15DRAFT_670590 [Coprinopsis marcescibilis]